MYCSRFHCADWGYLPWQYDSPWVSLNQCIPDAYQCRKRAFERPCWVWNFLHLWLLFLQVWLLVLHLALCSLDTVRFVRCWLEESEEANVINYQVISLKMALWMLFNKRTAIQLRKCVMMLISLNQNKLTRQQLLCHIIARCERKFQYLEICQG